MRKGCIVLISILFMIFILGRRNEENMSTERNIIDVSSISEFTDLNYYLFCDTAVNTNITDIEHDYAILGNGIDNIEEGEVYYQKIKDEFLLKCRAERDMDIVYISPDCKWTIIEKNYETDEALLVGQRKQILFYENQKKSEIISEYSLVNPIIIIRNENDYERMNAQLHEKLEELNHKCYLDGYLGGLTLNEQGNLGAAVKVKGNDYQQLDIWDIEKEKILWNFSLENVQGDIWPHVIQFCGDQNEGIIVILCGRELYEAAYPSNEIKYLGKDMYSLCYSPDMKYIAYSSIDHETGMGIGGDEMLEAGNLPTGIYVIEVETGKTVFIEINMEWYDLHDRKFLWIEKESFEKYIGNAEY